MVLKYRAVYAAMVETAFMVIVEEGTVSTTRTEQLSPCEVDVTDALCAEVDARLAGVVVL